MEVLAIINLCLLLVAALGTIPMTIFWNSPPGWANSGNKVKELVFEAGPVSILVTAVSILLFFVLSIILAIVVLVV